MVVLQSKEETCIFSKAGWLWKIDHFLLFCFTLVGTSGADSNSHYSCVVAVDVALVSVYTGLSSGWVPCLQVRVCVVIVVSYYTYDNY